MLAPWVADYIGIPFLPHGRTREGCDCYGLVRLVLAEQFGKNLPAFAAGYDLGDRVVEARLIDQGLPLVGATKVDLPDPGDIVLMAFVGIASHVGIYLGDGQVLHVAEGRDSILQAVSSPFLRSRIRGYYHVD